MTKCLICGNVTGGDRVCSACYPPADSKPRWDTDPMGRPVYGKVNGMIGMTLVDEWGHPLPAPHVSPFENRAPHRPHPYHGPFCPPGCR